MLQLAAMETEKRYSAAFALILCLVLLWGFGHRLYGTLTPQFIEVFDLNGARMAVNQAIYDIAYIFFAIPAALYARRFGYMAAILLSLGLLTIGTFTLYPASQMHAYPTYLVATSFLVLGWVVLENAINPLVVAFGPQQTAARRLNLVQCFYPLGAIAGIYAGHWVVERNLALPHAGDSYAITHPYILMGAVVLLLAFVIEEIKFPGIARSRTPRCAGLREEARTILSQPHFPFALAAQFCCVILVGTVWSLAGQSAGLALPESSQSWVKSGFFLCTLLFAAGRITGTGLMFRFRAEWVLTAMMALAALMAIGGAITNGPERNVIAFALNVPLAITWPTIIGLSLKNRNQSEKLASGILNTAGAFGGLAIELMNVRGSLPDSFQFALAAVCCLVILGFALKQQGLFSTVSNTTHSYAPDA